MRAPNFVLTNSTGKMHVVGMRRFVLTDLYYLLMQRSWVFLGAFVVLGYFLLNTAFALIYLADGDGIANAVPGSFGDRFFFSVNTLSTLGFGFMYPRTLFTNTVVTVESMLGLLGFAMVTGIFFAKFSRPRARVIFSRKAVVGSHDGVNTLMFRMANERANYIADATVNVSLVVPSLTAEGRRFAKIIDLPLQRQRSPMFILTWTALHAIDEKSPLFGITADSLIAAGTVIVCSLSGYDSTMGQIIHARNTYAPHDVAWDARFVDIIGPTADGEALKIEYASFHATEPVR